MWRRCSREPHDNLDAEQPGPANGRAARRRVAAADSPLPDGLGVVGDLPAGAAVPPDPARLRPEPKYPSRWRSPYQAQLGREDVRVTLSTYGHLFEGHESATATTMDAAITAATGWGPDAVVVPITANQRS